MKFSAIGEGAQQNLERKEKTLSFVWPHHHKISAIQEGALRN